MKKICCLFILFLMTCILLTASGETAAESDSPRIILYTFYRQLGWGDRVQIGSVDENGVLRMLTGYDSSLKWPYEAEEQLKYLSQTEKFAVTAKLNYTDMYMINSLVSRTEDQGSQSVSAACDAGTEKSYAVRYSKDGKAEIILLGMSGDDFFENFDPDAQALYLLLRRLFPSVTTYAYDSSGMGPRGFTPVPMAEFVGLDRDAAANAEIRAGYVDCEAGYLPLELTEEDRAILLDLVQNGMVTGKADCLMSDGDIYTYAFYDPDGELLGMANFNEGLLLSSGCRYYFGTPQPGDDLK